MSASSEALEKHPIVNWVIGNPFRQYPRMESSTKESPTTTANKFIQNLEDEAINDTFNGVKNFMAGCFASAIPVVGPVVAGIIWTSTVAHLGRGAVEAIHAISIRREASRRR